MRITIRLFAGLHDITGASRLERDVPDGSTVDTVWAVLAEEWPALAPHRRSVSAAVNEEFARFTSPLHDGDDVALLPPVSGG
jgi:molybdopterin converting factor subunit 1